MDNNQEINTQSNIKRPDGLTFICVLSFIGSGLAFISNFSIFLIYQDLLQALDEGNYIKFPGLDMEMVQDILLESGRSYYILISIFYFISFYGVYKMWHLKKIGIHFYAIAQIMLLIMPLLFIDLGFSVLPSVIITAAFIYIYSKYQNIMQ